MLKKIGLWIGNIAYLSKILPFALFKIRRENEILAVVFVQVTIAFAMFWFVNIFEFIIFDGRLQLFSKH